MGGAISTPRSRLYGYDESIFNDTGITISNRLRQSNEFEYNYREMGNL
jgi:hypothetical protein